MHQLILQLPSALDDFPDLLLSFIWLILQLHFILLVFVLVLLKRLLPIVEFLLLHDDVLFQQFCFLGFVWNRNLGHQDFARVKNEVAGWFLLLDGFTLVLDWLETDWPTALSGQLWLAVDLGYNRLIVANPRQSLMLQHCRVLHFKDVQLLLVTSCLSFSILLRLLLIFLFILLSSRESG